MCEVRSTAKCRGSAWLEVAEWVSGNACLLASTLDMLASDTLASDIGDLCSPVFVLRWWMSLLMAPYSNPFNTLSKPY